MTPHASEPVTLAECRTAGRVVARSANGEILGVLVVRGAQRQHRVVAANHDGSYRRFLPLYAIDFLKPVN